MSFIEFLVGLCIVGILAGAAFLGMAAHQQAVQLHERGCAKTGNSQIELYWSLWPQAGGGTMLLPQTITTYEWRCPDNGQIIWF